MYLLWDTRLDSASKMSVHPVAKRFAFFGLVVLLAVPSAAWAFVKPLRVLAPELAGVRCYARGVCTDDISHLAEATILKSDAVKFVSIKLGAIDNAPRVIFCSSATCDAIFGVGRRASYTVGASGIVIGMRGWQPYHVRHEFIHHVQSEHLGAFALWLAKPRWFVEGMAYSLSDDPRHPLHGQFENYRAQFDQWASRAPQDQLWSRAKAL